MSIKVTWDNFNIVLVDNIILYRSTSPISLGSLPSPLATLAGTALEYTDTTVVRNTMYYYLAAAVKDGKAAYSNNLPYAFVPDTGPGPTELVRGNWEAGYFGSLTAAQFLTSAQLATATARAVTGTISTWYKCASKGKIVYFPDVIANASIQWTGLYASGLIYGTNDNGAYPPTASIIVTPTNQLKTVDVGTHTMRIRVPTGVNESSTIFNASLTPATHINSEIDLLKALGENTYGGADTLPHLFDKTMAAITTNLWTTHWTATSNVRIVPLGTMVGAGTIANNSTGWYPVLELALT